MVKVTFEYGNEADHKLVQEMIGEPVVICSNEIVERDLEAEETLAEKVAAEKKPLRDYQKAAVEEIVAAHTDTPAPTQLVEGDGAENKVDSGTITPAEKAITPEAALPLVAAYCQKNGLDKPQAFFARVGKGNIHELTPAELNELLAELEIEV